ncbi:glycosyltransferase family 2 protein [Limnoglobus roseus]|uniref:GT2 family glycosyltransferase n=1 Tax=Limnoglobus roseus TaxID=2598579 RepID=A0A5C1AEN9_9BACT|nr:glycosyltransferase [Limnoglobus roseus]QEL15564.1 GT2 family glycosyltransferase [Limnoglobus roseus]
MTTPEISVIMPAWNRAGYLPLAIQSVAEQTVAARLEVVVADDASTDDTAEVVRKLTDRWRERLRITYLALPKGGVCAARNAALAASRTPLVAFLDSDDVWEPTKLEAQVALLATDVGVVHTNFRYVDAAGRFTDGGGQRPNNPARGACLPALLAEDTVVFSSVLMRREVIDRAAKDEPHGLPFDPAWVCGEDYDLLLRAARLTGFGYAADALARYRVHPEQTGMANLPRVFKYHCQVQLDFNTRWGAACGFPPQRGQDAAREFLFGRAESLFWQREVDVLQQVCRVADDLQLSDARFTHLLRRANRPRWMYRVKDTLDSLYQRLASR